MTSITQNRIRKIIIALIWLGIWQIGAMLIKEEILLPSPLLVFKRFVGLLQEKDFYLSLLSSTAKIILGFIASTIVALVFAFISFKSRTFYDFINPIILIFRSIPLASIVIFLLFWINSDFLSIYVAFIMAMPIIYTNIYSGLMAIDREILEMAEVYRVDQAKKIRYIYLIKTKAFISSSIISVSGLVFKAGIAAEVIGLPNNSIGTKLYNAKVYLDMPGLMAWSMAILILSMVFERALKRFLGAKDD